jgi:hypothetical protein
MAAGPQVHVRGHPGAVTGRQKLALPPIYCVRALLQLPVGSAAEVETADERQDVSLLRESGDSIEGIDHPGMSATDDHDQSVPRFDENRLIIRDEIGFGAFWITEEC